VLNHDGGDLTLRCLESVLASDWPPAALEVVLVDNGSSDGVTGRVRRELPAVTVIEAGRNLGFSAGCNLGIRSLGAVDHVALVNNDATVAPGWLAPLVEALASGPRVGAACPKILFEGAYVDVTLASPTSARGAGDRRPLGVAVGGARVDGDDHAAGGLQLVRGFWGAEHPTGGGAPLQWTDGHGHLRVPVRADRSLPACQLLLAAPERRAVIVVSGGERVEHQVGPDPAWYEVRLGGEPFDVINNVGSVLLPDGYGADRGYLERDEGQYEVVEEVFAWCGAAVVLSRSYLDDVGLFPERYFLYYEDFDLSWRGRARGWRYLYVPGPPVRHRHSASTVAGSRLHEHHSERNRLLTLVRNAPWPMAAGAAGRHLLVTASYARRDVVGPLARGQHPSWEMVGRRGRAFGSFLRTLAPAVVERRRLRRRRTVPDRAVLTWASAPRR
jgi:GT2 family glycosyltransferase